MADTDTTTNPCATSADFLHASSRASTDVESNASVEGELLNVIEEVLEEARSELVLVNSILGSVQTALDPEAVTVKPPVFFPEVLEHTRQLINMSVRRLAYEDIRRQLHRRIGGTH